MQVDECIDHMLQTLLDSSQYQHLLDVSSAFPTDRQQKRLKVLIKEMNQTDENQQIKPSHKYENAVPHKDNNDFDHQSWPPPTRFIKGAVQQPTTLADISARRQMNRIVGQMLHTEGLFNTRG